MNRSELIQRLRDTPEGWDMIVVGGGATGVGIAIDAASRGYSVALLEQSDFGKATSSRSTKLVHGGVRYLQQGNVPLVMEALKERGILRANAPHLVSDLPFVVPNYKWWEAPFYGIGMRVYDVLAGRYGFGSSKNLSVEETVERIPTIETDGLRGGVVYHDGQFDDARLLIDMVSTAVDQGAVPVNYCRVTGLLRSEDGFVDGVRVVDQEEEAAELELRGKVVVNATGIFADELRRMDDPDAPPIMRPSQGIHIVLDRDFLPGDSAIMVPKTDDGRVLFAIPWHDRVIVGTTDTPVDGPSLEPVPMAEEVDFLLEHTARYLTRDPRRDDVRSVFAGIRPLVGEVAASGSEDGESVGSGKPPDTAEISREHQIRVSDSGLVTIAGGKWTTYRKMAEEVVDHASTLAGLEPRECVTRDLNIHGFHQHPERFGEYAIYGSVAAELTALVDDEPELEELVHPQLRVRVGQVVWAARHEMARTVDDVLARRTRALLLDARAAYEAAPKVAEILARELASAEEWPHGREEEWMAEQVEAFQAIASGYIPG
ncbi:MAG: glycerol-3-phosphate dehydrogenase/oxidase [Gemmatimonadota bacterium]